MATSERASFRETPGSRLHARGRSETLLAIAIMLTPEFFLVARTAFSKPSVCTGHHGIGQQLALHLAGWRALSAPLLPHTSSALFGQRVARVRVNHDYMHDLSGPMDVCTLS